MYQLAWSGINQKKVQCSLWITVSCTVKTGWIGTDTCTRQSSAPMDTRLTLILTMVGKDKTFYGQRLTMTESRVSFYMVTRHATKIKSLFPLLHYGSKWPFLHDLRAHRHIHVCASMDLSMYRGCIAWADINHMRMEENTRRLPWESA